MFDSKSPATDDLRSTPDQGSMKCGGDLLYVSDGKPLSYCFWGRIVFTYLCITFNFITLLARAFSSLTDVYTLGGSLATMYKRWVMGSVDFVLFRLGGMDGVNE